MVCSILSPKRYEPCKTDLCFSLTKEKKRTTTTVITLPCVIITVFDNITPNVIKDINIVS